MIGRTLAHYQIQEKLGEGGMGVVYRALDTHLDRPVAIKVLRAEAVADPERKRRFVQEAKAASALNHPNIIVIHDIDLIEGTDFMVMEYVAGKSLDRVIGRKGLRLGETLEYTVEITDALAAAHAAGIVHRDIKPGNIMVNEKGHVKILDFGLAKLTERSADGDPEAATVDAAALTEHGSILGTVAYMSPEQAEGQTVDARSDIFSFGSVLYEMVTGRRAFQGESKMAVLSAILREEPKPAREIVEDIPAELERILNYCLRKDRRRRFQHMDDLKIALEGLKEESESGKLSRPATPAKRPWPWIAAAAVAMFAVAVALALWLRRSPAPAPTQGPTLTRLTSDSGLTTAPALSPDGRMLAYASDRAGQGNLDIWVQHLSGGQAVRLTRGEADESEPDISPDGARIAFRSERDGGGIYVTPTLGGEPRFLARQGRRPRFSPDGAQIAYWTGNTGSGRGDRGGKIFVVASAGGPPRQLFADIWEVVSPLWLPDGKHLLFWGMKTAGGTIDWWVGAIDGGEPVATGAAAAARAQELGTASDPAAFLAQGNRVLFSATQGDSTNLWELSLAPRTWQVAGPPRRLTFGTGREEQPSVAADGRLVFSSGELATDIWSLPLDPRGKVAGPIERLTHDAALDRGPSLTADGNRMVFSSNRAGNFDIWVKDLPSGKETPLTATPASEYAPVISPDGSRVAYNVVGQRGQGFAATYVVAASGPGVPEEICEGCGRPMAFSPDGVKLLSFQTGGINLLDVASRQKVDLIKHPNNELRAPQFSPDGRWITFRWTDNPATRRLWVVAFRGPVLHEQSEWIQVTDGKGLDREPMFSPDGNQIWFLSDRDGFRCIWAQRLDPATKRPIGPPAPLHHLHGTRLSLMHIQDTGSIWTSAARSRLAFALGERTGNIWMTKLTP